MSQDIKKIIYLAKRYDLVVGDRFELFYRGILRLVSPYHYNIKVSCKKGKPYPRYFCYTPTIEEIGEYELKIEIFNDFDDLLDQATTKLVVNNPIKPTKKLNILCIGDSLTTAGYWTMEGYRRLCLSGGNPVGLGFGDIINFIGLCNYKKDDVLVKYEGYGGWQWKTFCSNTLVSKTSSVWVYCSNNLTEADQHSIWQNGDYFWILETICKDKLKFKRGENNNLVNPPILNTFVHVSNAIHKDDIIINNYEFEFGNPFWNEEKNDIDFNKYIEKNNFEIPDYIYIMLTWNGLHTPYSNDFSIHEKYATHIITNLHKDFPKAYIICMGIPLNSINGGIANNYGASGPYSDWYGTLTTCLNYNNWLEELTKRYDFCEYVDVKGQFDVENNMPQMEEKVNSRNEKKELLGTNGVHPGMCGYMQIGDVFFRSLVRIMSFNKGEKNEI